MNVPTQVTDPAPTVIPNEAGAADADNNQVFEVAPADTSSTATNEPSVAPTEETPQETPAEETPTTDETPVEETPSEEPAELSLPSAEYLQKLTEAQNLELPTDTPDIFDEYGNIDPAKFVAYQSARDQMIFDKAIGAVNARSQAEQAENAAWDTVFTTYPEIKEHNLDNALRGARIQDITAGGDGDLARLAKDLAAPFRKAKIEAVEQTNKVVEQAESLETFKPTNATPPKEAPTLMSQLQTAVQNGDSELATQLRHAIRKERIYGTDK